jgi:DNA-binding FadR family transcriptional regulator
VAALRAALQILGQYGVVRKLTGRAGGIIVGRPDPQIAVRAAVLHLARTRPDVCDLIELRARLDALCVQLATRRLTEDDRHALADALDAARRTRNPQATDADALQAMLGALSKNRTLEIFQQITAELLATLAPAGDARRGHGGHDAREAMARAELHEALESLLAHDHVAANEAMLRRVRALSSAAQQLAAHAPRPTQQPTGKIRA